MNDKPLIKKDPLYQMLRSGDVDGFNKAIASGQTCDLTGCDFRSLELQGLKADGLDFSNSYFRLADLRGIDFSKANVNGASIHEAKISGVLFPTELSSDEITMSLIRGTRMRYGC
ncbi:MAG: pentapeptide repeat-containing protein [Gammaproteobacteria bacterium]|nr:pentapeptide repeat-containing protein [Gammaproteobacteria bacterium]MDH5691892.1 pentapeptide repeat-containing protein [Gammaproteobacteria bacterium]